MEKKDIIKFTLSCAFTVLIVYFIHPKFDFVFIFYTVILILFWAGTLIYNLKNPEKAKKLREEYNKRTPEEINRHIFEGLVFSTKVTLKVFLIAMIIMFIIVFIFSIIFPFIFK